MFARVFQTAVDPIGVERAVMIGDGGGPRDRARTRTGTVVDKGGPTEVRPTAIVDSIVDVPVLLARILPR